MYSCPTNTSIFGLHHCKMSVGGTATDEQKETLLNWINFVSKTYNGYIAARIKPVRYDVTQAEGNQKGRVELVCETTIEEGS